MRQAEADNEFSYKPDLPATKNGTNDHESDEEDDDDHDHKSSLSKNDENSISNLAKKLLQAKLEKADTDAKPPTIKTTTNTAINVKKAADADLDKDDLDLELDIDLENVDTTDVNLDDDISD